MKLSVHTYKDSCSSVLCRRTRHNRLFYNRARLSARSGRVRHGDKPDSVYRWIGTFPGVIVGLFDSPTEAVLVITVVVIVQQLESQLISRKLWDGSWTFTR